MWYSAGTIEVPADGQVATGTATAFLKNVRIGDGLTIAGSASMHEVTNIASDTQLTFSPPYSGAAGAGKQYRIAPIQGYVKEAADLLRALTQNLGSFANNANLTALAAAVGAANKGLMFTAPGAIGTFDLSAQGRVFLGAATQAAQQSALGLVPASSATDFTAARLMTAGYAGLGASAASIPASIDDLNNIQFFQGNSNNNNPFGSTGSTGIHLQQASSFGWQLAGPNGGNGLNLKWRNRSAASVWGQWRDVWDSTNQLAIGVNPLSARTALEINQGVVIQPTFFDFSAGPYTVTGQYTLPALADTGFSNRPVSASGLSRAYLQVYATGGYITQALSLNNNRTFSRSFNGSSWTVWCESWNTANLNPNKLEDRTIATLPAAGPNKGQMFHCTNTARGLRPVISDGVDWRRIEDNALLSAA